MSIAISIAALLGGIGVFMVGMKFMSTGLESIASRGLEKVLSKISNNRFMGLVIGTLVTAIVQSSSATTVMSIGLVNAGVMTFAQSAAIIVGANIGTTVTGFLTAIAGLDIDILAFLYIFAAIGIFLKMFSKKDRTLSLGDILLGLGLIFIGLDLMSGAFKTDVMNQTIKNIFSNISFPLLLLTIGILITALIQSSSAVTGIVIAMASAGAIELEYAFFIILGANIGTCITGIIASIGSTTNAKKVALFQIIFNTFGVLLFLPLTWIFKDQFIDFFERMLPGNITFQIAFYHLLFNLSTSLLVLPFLKFFIGLVNKLIVEKESSTEFRLLNIDDKIINTPAVAVNQIKKEIIRMANMARENLDLIMSSILKNTEVKRDDLIYTENYLNYLNKAIATHLITLSGITKSRNDERIIGSFYHVINDIERIGDHAENFLEIHEVLNKDNLSFSKRALLEIDELYQMIIRMYDIAIIVLKENRESRLPQISSLEETVDMFEINMKNSYVDRIKNEPSIVETSPFFFEIISGLERIGDHLTNIAYSITSPTGDEK
ncbi:Na/Pi cotransporter family protein [Acholeplasma sp. OttesenSCG-928-E16]|nr:Na/Pi cotransporter family protein [Acholeplasma sp. OttesenSCG-928-E16]